MEKRPSAVLGLDAIYADNGDSNVSGSAFNPLHRSAVPVPPPPAPALPSSGAIVIGGISTGLRAAAAAAASSDSGFDDSQPASGAVTDAESDFDCEYSNNDGGGDDIEAVPRSGSGGGGGGMAMPSIKGTSATTRGAEEEVQEVDMATATDNRGSEVTAMTDNPLHVSQQQQQQQQQPYTVERDRNPYQPTLIGMAGLSNLPARRGSHRIGDGSIVAAAGGGEGREKEKKERSIA
jgi:hypothetical protein